MRVSIRQVAAKANVSRQTVSSMLNGRTDQASEETRLRVLEAARELGYVPVAQPALQSRKSRTRTLGLIFDEAAISHMHFGFATYLGIMSAARAAGHDLLTLLRDEPEWMTGREEVRFLDGRCDGFIFIQPRHQYNLLEQLAAYGVPVVSCYSTDVPPQVGWVIPDNAGAMRLAVDHVIAQGHRRIAHLCGPQIYSDARQRQAGFQAAADAAGLTSKVLPGTDADRWKPDRDLIAGALRELMAEEYTAVVCASDGLALALWDVAMLQGLSVPRDISVMGADNLAESSARGLSSINYSFQKFGEEAALALLDRIGGAPTAQCRRTTAAELVVRSSVAPAASKIANKD